MPGEPPDYVHGGTVEIVDHLSHYNLSYSLFTVCLVPGMKGQVVDPGVSLYQREALLSVVNMHSQVPYACLVPGAVGMLVASERVTETQMNGSP